MTNLLLFPIHGEPDQRGNQAEHVPSLENRLIRASAGTGKTYQLTSRYLKLVCEGASPESILATTFTRKAAGEILQRVIVRLAQAADGEAERAKLSAAIEVPTLTRRDCQDKLAMLTRQVHRVRILTLDAFFMQIATSFSLELGLTPGWQVVEEGAEASRLNNESIAGVLREESLENLLTLVHQLAPKGEAKRSLAGLLRSSVRDAYRLFLESDASAWDMIEVPTPLPGDDLADLVQEMSHLELRTKTMKQACANDIDRILAEDWKGFFDAGPTLVKSIMDNSEKYRNSVIPEEVRQVYRRFLRHLKAMVLHSARAQTRGTHQFLAKYHDHYQRLKEDQRLYEFDDVTRLLSERSQTDDLQTLAFRLDAGIDHLLLDEFQDTSIPQWQALAPLARRCTSDEPGRSFFCVGDAKQAIYGWRGGSSEIFDLLDRRLPNLVNSQLQQSRRSSQVVVDVVNEVFDFLPTWEKLKRAQRAATKWEFPRHTTIHGEMPGHVTLETAEEGDDFRKEAQETEVLRRAAARTASLVAHAPGRTVGILCRTNRMVARIIHELQRCGVSASEEGGNALTDSAAVELVLSLLQLADHPSDTVAAFHLAASPWSEALESRLLVANRVDRDAITSASDDVAAVPHANVAAAVDGEAERNSPVVTDKTSPPQSASETVYSARSRRAIDPTAARGLARRARQQLLDQGYGDCVRTWANQLHPFCNGRESRRLNQLVEKAYEYQAKLEAPRQLGVARQRRTLTRPAEFARYVRETRVSDPSADTVRAMTVHQAKGLQFDAVILPDLLGPLVEGEDTFLYRRPTITSNVDLVCRYMGKNSGRPFLPDECQPLFDQHEDRKARESLCVLYVAMTRAVHALHMIIPSTLQKMKSNKESPAYLLKDVFSQGSQLDPATTLFEAGDRQWFQPDSAVPPTTAEVTSAPDRPQPKLATCAGGKRRHMETIAPSQLVAGRAIRMRDRFTLEDGDARRQHGSLLHAWLSSITWLESQSSSGATVAITDGGDFCLTGVRANADLRRLAQRFGRTMDIESALRQFRQLVREDPLTTILHRETYENSLRRRSPDLPSRVDLEVRNEQRVAGRDAATVIAGTVDRLVLIRNADKLIAADIIDYKTSNADDLSTRGNDSSRHQLQLDAYRRVLASSLRLNEDAVTGRIVFLPTLR